MFYTKTKLSDKVEIKAELNDENIFTTCPRCGKEVGIDGEILASVLADGDLYSTAVYCEDCSDEFSKGA